MRKRGEAVFELKTGEIIPGIGIGPFKLGANESTIFQISPDFSVREPCEGCRIYAGKDIMIWVDTENGKIDQILVKDPFQGKLLGRFGIGTFFREIEEYLNEKVKVESEITCVYEFPSLPGVSFELEDVDVPDDVLIANPYEELAPIECISVYLPRQKDDSYSSF